VTKRRVRFTETAKRHLRREKEWLIENRGHAEILSEEIENALRILQVLPGIGTRQERAGIPTLRRVFLEKIGCHLYYSFDDHEVIIRALWGARKRRHPRFQQIP
jgi:plasmid stabilization system protein ParE